MSKVAGRKKRIIITTAAMLAIGGGAAFAYWSGTGTTTGTATAGQSVAFKVASTPAVGGALTPGGPIQGADFTVKNENTGAQILSAVAVKVANSDGTDWVSVPGCSAADFSVGTPVITKGQVAAGAVVTGNVTVQMVNLDANQDKCQGVTVPLFFSAS